MVNQFISCLRALIKNLACSSFQSTVRHLLIKPPRPLTLEASITPLLQSSKSNVEKDLALRD